MKKLILSLVCFLPLSDQAEATNRGFFQRFRARQRVVQRHSAELNGPLSHAQRRVERVRVVERVVVPQAVYAAPQAFFVAPQQFNSGHCVQQLNAHPQQFKVQQFNGGGCSAFFKGH